MIREIETDSCKDQWGIEGLSPPLMAASESLVGPSNTSMVFATSIQGGN